MQFAMLSAFTLAIATLAAATPTRRNDVPPSNQCNTGAVQCCQSTQTTTSATTSTLALLGLLGVVVGDLTGDIGVTCSDIPIIGASSGACSEAPLCCTDNSFNGVVALGCVPIDLSL